tara:strand:+ start:303 stop:419 length:117 start_codon:yes stop_codon:yes gene_type:complete
MNTHIQDGAVIIANSLVRGIVPSFTIVAGIPATIVRKR